MTSYIVVEEVEYVVDADTPEEALKRSWNEPRDTWPSSVRERWVESRLVSKREVMVPQIYEKEL